MSISIDEAIVGRIVGCIDVKNAYLDSNEKSVSDSTSLAVGNLYRIDSYKIVENEKVKGLFLKLYDLTGRRELGYYSSKFFVPKDIYNDIPKTKKTEGTKTMDKTIIKMYPKTEDAVVVEKYFGKQLADPFLGLLASSKSQVILAAAQAKQAEEEAAAKK